MRLRRPMLRGKDVELVATAHIHCTRSVPVPPKRS
jgi:hypothetical protein